MLEEKEYLNILDKVSRYCSYSERCIYDVKQKLFRLGINNSDVVTRIINDLTKEGFVDERRYAINFSLGKFSMNRWGRIKIKQQLISKLIQPDLIKEALLSIDDELYAISLQEQLLLKWTQLTDDPDAYQKTIRYAQTRGFEFPLILELMPNVTQVSSISG